MLNSQEQVRFETLVLPHLDAAFNLARWLLRSGADAEDVSQEAMLRAYRFFNGFSWRRCARLAVADRAEYLFHPGWEKNRRVKDMTEFDEELHGPPSPTPESLAYRSGYSRAPYSRTRVFAAPRYPGDDCAPRAGRVFALQGDLPPLLPFLHRYSHVQGFPCPPAASASTY